MIKGWKNNPDWVKHYADIQESREEAIFQRNLLELNLNMQHDTVDAAVKRMQALEAQRWEYK